MGLKPDLSEMLSGFDRRMKFINIAKYMVDYSFKDSIKEMIPDRNVMDNLIVLVLVYIKERTLGSEQNCKLDDIADFLDDISCLLPEKFRINSTELAKFIVVDVLQKGGVLTSYTTIVPDKETLVPMPVRLIEEEQNTYHLTDDAFDFLFRSKEIESELDYSVTRFRMAEYMKRDNYAEALDQSRELVSKIRNMKVSMDSFLRRCRENIASISVEQYELVISRIRSLLETEYAELRSIQENAEKRADRLLEASRSGINIEELKKHRKALNEIIRNIQLTIDEQRGLINKKMSLSDEYQKILNDSYAMSRFERMDFDKDIMKEMRTGSIPLETASLKLLFPLIRPELMNMFSIENLYEIQTRISEIVEEDYEDIEADEQEADPVEIRNLRFYHICRDFFRFISDRTLFKVSEFVSSLDNDSFLLSSSSNLADSFSVKEPSLICPKRINPRGFS